MRTRFQFLCCISLAVGMGCAGAFADNGAALQGPTLISLSTMSAEVGDSIRFAGESFVDPQAGWVDVTFRGEFVPADGSDREPVELAIPLQVGSDGKLLWERFGAYRIPFTADGARGGQFEGVVFATNHYFDGTVAPQSPETWMPVSFQVEPSLVVLDFRAGNDTWVSDCVEPAPNALTLVPYALRVRAIDFEMAELEFHVSEGLLVDGEPTTDTTVINVTPTSNEHAVQMQFAPVPEHVDGYRVSVNVYARGTDGSEHHIMYPFVVRRPLQVYFTTPMLMAQTYEPEPVSGCIPGGPSSVETSYAESHSETRTRAVEHTVSRGWEETYGEEHSETWGVEESKGGAETRSRTTAMTNASTTGGSTTSTDMFSTTNGRSRTNTVDFSESASGTYGWNVGHEDYSQHEVGGTAGGGASFLGFVEVKAEASYGYTNGNRDTYGENGSETRGSQVGVGASDTASSSSTASSSRADSRHWSRTQSYTEANSFSQTETWNQSLSFAEAQTESHSVSESLGTSDTEIFTVSSTDAESLSITASVWAGQMGMWYRQTTRLARFGVLVAYDLCGNGSEVGEIVLDDWAWAPDLGLGDECPPQSNFPPAQCYHEPCSGY